MTVRKNDVVTDFSLEDELRLGLLQDIDNFVIGEIKGGEALHVFTTAMSTDCQIFWNNPFQMMQSVRSEGLHSALDMFQLQWKHWKRC